MMDISQRKEQFSIAYVRAIASVAGFSVSTPGVDDDSVGRRFRPDRRGYSVSAQDRPATQTYLGGRAPGAGGCLPAEAEEL